MDRIKASELQVGDVILIDDYRRRGVVQSIHSSMATVIIDGGGWWGIEVRDDDGYWGGNNKMGYARFLDYSSPWPSGGTYSGVWDGFEKGEADYPLKLSNSLTGQVVALKDGLENNIVYLVDNESKVFSFVDFFNHSGLLIKDAEGKEYAVVLSAVRVFLEEAHARNYIDSIKNIELARKAQEEEKKSVCPYQVGSYVKLDYPEIARQLRLSRSTYHAFRSDLKWLAGAVGLVHKVVKMGDIRPFGRKKGVTLSLDPGVEGVVLSVPSLLVLEEATAQEYTDSIKAHQAQKAVRAIIARIKQNSADSTSSIVQLQSQLVHKIRERSENLRAIWEATESPDKVLAPIIQKLQADIEWVKTGKLIEKINFSADELIVQIFTKDLYISRVFIENSGRDVTSRALPEPLLIGGYEFMIDFIQAKTYVYRKSVIDGLNGPHPHINGDVLCLGNMQSHLPAMLANFDVGSIVDLFLEVLQTVQIGSTYINLNDFWDEAPVSDYDLDDGFYEDDDE